MGESAVLVVEGDRDSRDALCALLRAFGYVAIGEASVPAARHALRTIALDAVVMDVILPDGDGTALLRDVPVGPGVIVISTDTRARTAVRERGFVFLEKPFDVADFLAALARCISVGRRGPIRRADDLVATTALVAPIGL